MLKRCFLFVSYFPVIYCYLKMTGFLLRLGNIPLFLLCESLLVFLVYLLGKKFKIFEIKNFSSSDWGIWILGFMVYWIGYGLTDFPNFQSGAQDYVTAASHNTAIYFFYDAFCAPFMEEMMTRGVMQKGAFHHSYLGLLISSAVFSMMHEPGNVWSFLPYFVAGLVLGYMYKRSDNLAPSILLHVTINTLAWIQPFIH